MSGLGKSAYRQYTSNDADADEAPEPMNVEGSEQTDASADKSRVAPATQGMAKKRWILNRATKLITSTVIAVASIWVFIDLLENTGLLAPSPSLPSDCSWPALS